MHKPPSTPYHKGTRIFCFDPLADHNHAARKYTIILKDTLLPPSTQDGREQATISWEYDFSVSDAVLTPITSTPTPITSAANEKSSPSASARSRIYIPFTDLAPTYRGKPLSRSKVQPLARGSIKRYSLMNRSFFGTQSGSFSLYVQSIAAYRKKRSRMEAFLSSKIAMPVVLSLSTIVLMRGMMWGIDTFIRPAT